MFINETLRKGTKKTYQINQCYLKLEGSDRKLSIDFWYKNTDTNHYTWNVRTIREKGKKLEQYSLKLSSYNMQILELPKQKLMAWYKWQTNKLILYI